MREQEAMYGRTHLSDLPKDAAITSRQLEHGDILIFGSDGVWDNMSPQDMLDLVSKQMMDRHGWETKTDGVQPGPELALLTNEAEETPDDIEGKLQETLAVSIASLAKIYSLDLQRDGPFAKEYQKKYPYDKYHGGKADDITVVVVIVLKES
jgi:protein phosphatase PTC7